MSDPHVPLGYVVLLILAVCMGILAALLPAKSDERAVVRGLLVFTLAMLAGALIWRYLL